jgi:predicted transcriptional regulator
VSKDSYTQLPDASGLPLDTVLTIQVTDPMKETLKQMAARRYTSVSIIVRDAIFSHCMEVYPEFAQLYAANVELELNEVKSDKR